MAIMRRGVVAAIGACLAGCSPPTPAPVALPADERIAIDGWELVERRRGGSTFYYQPGLDTQVDRLEGALDAAQSALVDELGPPPLIGMDWYLFRHQDHTAAFESLGDDGPEAAIGPWAGVFRAWGPHAGIYLDVSALRDDADAAAIAAHELTHAWEHELANGSWKPAWFTEGLAELVERRARAAVDPAGADRQAFLDDTGLASAWHAQRWPSLPDLEEPAAMSAANWLTYPTARVAVAALTTRLGPGGLRGVLQAVGGRSGFREALVARGDSAEATQAQLVLEISRLAAEFPPGLYARPAAGGKVALAWVGVGPFEQTVWLFEGPAGCRRGGGTPASPVGRAAWVFGAGVNPRCAGVWTLHAMGAYRAEHLEFAWSPAP
jgi:hypothetical protein